MRIGQKHSFGRVSSGWPAFTALDPTIANYPFLANSVVFWDTDVANNDASWTDAYSGIQISPSSGNWSKDAEGVYATAGAFLVTGALPDPTGKHVVVFEVAKPKSNNDTVYIYFYDPSTLGTAGFAGICASRTGAAGTFDYYHGPHTTDAYMTFTDNSATKFDVNGALCAGLAYSNWTDANGTGSVAYRVGPVSSVLTTVTINGVKGGASAMTMGLTPANNPADGIEGIIASTAIRMRQFGLLLFASAPPDLQASIEYMQANPGYFPAAWAGLS